MLEALVLTAQTLVILDRAKNLGAEQAVPLRLEGSVVDGLGLFNFAKRPRPIRIASKSSFFSLLSRFSKSFTSYLPSEAG
jgi:hypothetical protein